MSNYTKKKILMISSHPVSFLNFRGDLAQALVKKGYEVVAVVPEGADNDADYAAIGISKRSIHLEKNSLNPFGSLKYQKALRAIIEEERPNKIFAYTSKPVIFGSIAAHKAGVKEVYSLVCGIGSVYSKNDPKHKLIQIVMGILYHRAFRYNAKVIFQNPDDIAEFTRRHYLPKSKCELVNGSGVNLQKFKRAPLPKNPSFIMVSRIIRAKGVVEYFKAAGIVKSQHPEVEFTYIGEYDQSYKKDFKAIKPFIDAGIVHYISYTNKVADFIAKAKVCVLPSYYREGIPKTLLEATAMGRPIITTNTPGCRETIVDGTNGLFVRIHNATDLASKMLWMIEHDDRLAEMGEASYQICLEKFTIDKINQRMLEIMEVE